jgi:hypothetical protein
LDGKKEAQIANAENYKKKKKGIYNLYFTINSIAVIKSREEVRYKFLH